ncbi:MAG: DUF2254 domain-containing protein [Desulfovibrionales bacterium]
MAHLLRLWERLRTSFWFLPAIMIVLSGILAQVCIAFEDSVWVSDLSRNEWIFIGGAEGARAVLSTIAGSMITIAGVVFSITIVVISLATAQLGPRLIRNFVNDTGNQFALGAFTSTFVFNILVLRKVSTETGLVFIPHLSVTVAILLAVGSIGVLIYFIHHIVSSIQVPQVVAAVGGELDQGIDRIFPPGEEPFTRYDELRAMGGLPRGFPEGGVPLSAVGQGFLVMINDSGLVRIAEEQDCIIHLVRKPGDYLIQGAVLAKVWGKGIDRQELEKAVARCITFAKYRSALQDLEFVFDQLVQIAVRALSPGINDPFTAINCLDRLGAGLARMAERELVNSPYFLDRNGDLRLVRERFTFESMVESSLSPIRNYGSGSVEVMLHLIDVLNDLAPITDSRQREVLLEQGRAIGEHVSRQDWPTHDLKNFRNKWQSTLRNLEGS